MKRLLLLLFACAGLTFAQQCNQTGTFTAAANGTSYHNGRAGSNCTTWTLTYWNTGFTVVSISLQGAPDSSGSAGSFADLTSVIFGSNPATSTTGGTIIIQSPTFYPWIRVVANTLTGTGTVTYTLSGTNGNAPSPVPSPVYGTVLSGQQAVTASAAALATNNSQNVCIQALSTNVISVYLGPSTVTTSTGLELPPGAAWCGPISNTNLVYVRASTTGASVSWFVVK